MGDLVKGDVFLDPGATDVIGRNAQTEMNVRCEVEEGVSGRKPVDALPCNS
jgi:hypothetical protein